MKLNKRDGMKKETPPSVEMILLSRETIEYIIFFFFFMKIIYPVIVSVIYHYCKSFDA